MQLDNSVPIHTLTASKPVTGLDADLQNIKDEMEKAVENDQKPFLTLEEAADMATGKTNLSAKVEVTSVYPAKKTKEQKSNPF